jgi:2-polyprenyl-3-methyl-5-hydroxy-6-metoxy-1,4-benzoquinol methylase
VNLLGGLTQSAPSARRAARTGWHRAAPPVKQVLMGMYARAVEQNHRNIASMLERDTRARLLDMGCDDGVLTMSLACTIGTNDVHGIDIIQSRLERAERAGVSTQCQDLNDPIGLESGRFDVIHANQVIEHLASVDHFCSEVRRLLRPGGYAIISTENASSWCNVFASAMGWQIFSLTNVTEKALGIGNPLAIHRGERQELSSWLHRTILNFRGLLELLELHGLRVERVKGAGYFPLPGGLAAIDPVHSHFLAVKVRRS